MNNLEPFTPTPTGTRPLKIAALIVLAGLNLFAGWCAGCTMYYWLNRLGVPGFDHQPVEVR